MKKLVLALIAGSFMLMPLTAQAAPTQWQKTHPWRTYDNSRLCEQNQRINAGVRNGSLTRGEAHRLRAEEHRIRQEERLMARDNPGRHLSAAEQRTLNQQLNRNSRAIYREKHD